MMASRLCLPVAHSLDGFDDMESLIYAKLEDLRSLGIKKRAARVILRKIQREKPYWKLISAGRRAAKELEREERYSSMDSDSDAQSDAYSDAQSDTYSEAQSASVSDAESGSLSEAKK